MTNHKMNEDVDQSFVATQVSDAKSFTDDTTATEEDKLYGMLAHLLAFSGYFIPLGHILGPLVIWLMKKDTSSYIDHHGKESLNFQISLTIYILVSVITVIGPIIIGVIGIILVIIAAIKAKEGERYTYPCCLRFIK